MGLQSARLNAVMMSVVTARMTPIDELPRNLCHSRADAVEKRVIAELGVCRGVHAPEPWRQRLNVSTGGQGDEWERVRSEVLRAVRRKIKGTGGCACGKFSRRRDCPVCCHGKEGAGICDQARPVGHARLSGSTGLAKDGVAFLQLEHIAKIKWQWDYTGSVGTTHEHVIRDSSYRPSLNSWSVATPGSCS
jgi:hypothetical protein